MADDIGFIGAGVMGAPMARHLLGAGFRVQLHTRTPSKARPVLDAGAEWRPDPATLAGRCGTLMTMVGFPEDVRALYFGPEGLIENAREGALLIDFTTSEPELAEAIARAGETKGLACVDAPVSGGDKGAREATLSIMAGGSETAFARAEPFFSRLGANVVRQGAPGAGQHAKMGNQIAIASGIMGVCEAIRYAEQAGLAPETVLKSIASGAAGSWSMTHLAPRILAGDLEPGFYVRHFIKDLAIALRSAERMGLDLPGLSLAKRLYDELSAMGGDDQGTHALIRWYRGA